MFNYRQSRRRFRLGNLARLVQLRQSVSNQPPLPAKDLQDVLLQSPPQSPAFQPPPYQFSSPMPSPSTLSPSISKAGEDHQSSPPPEPKLSPPSPAFQPQPQSPSLSPPMSQASPPSLSESHESQPPLPPPKSNTPPSTLNANEESQSQPLPPSPPPSKSTEDTQFRSVPPSLVSPPSLSKSAESQPPLPPPETKTPPSPPSTLKAHTEFQSQPSPPLPPSKSIDETRFRSLLPSQASPPLLSPHKSGEPQQPLPPPEAKIPPLPPSLSESGESQPPLPPPETKTPPSTLNAAEESQPQPPPPLLPSRAIDETRFQSSPRSQESRPSLSKSSESQPPLPPAEAKIPPSSPSTLNATEESRHPLLLPSKSIETRFQSSPPSQASPPPLSESREFQPPLPPREAITPPSALNASEEFQPQPLSPSKSIDENRFQSTPPLPPVSPKQPSKSVEEPKSTPTLPESGQQPRSQTHSSPPQSSSLLPKATENLQFQSPMPPSSPTALTSASQPPSPPESPPSIPSPLKSQIIPSPKPSLPQIKSHSPKPVNTEPQNSQDHNKDKNHIPEKPDAKLMKIPAEKTEIAEEVKKNRGKAIWSEKTNSVPTMMMMFVNSNVQGINTSLSLDSSSIDHEPGVHLTIDYDFSSTLFN